MFFGLMNSPAMFQTMMNEILWDLINTGKVVSFMDNVIIGTEREEEYDELVEEVVRRLAEKNLYIKLEKYKWKMKEVGFLEVVIGLEGYKNGKRKSERSARLANTKVCQGYTEILGIGKLLLPIHQRFCVHS